MHSLRGITGIIGIPLLSLKVNEDLGEFGELEYLGPSLAVLAVMVAII